jgi:hypothetical protein
MGGLRELDDGQLGNAPQLVDIAVHPLWLCLYC